MYIRGGFIFLFTWFLTVRRVALGKTMGGNENNNNTSNDLDSEWPVKVSNCFEHQLVLKCFETLLEEKYQTKMELDKIKDVANVFAARKQSSSLETLTVRKLITLMDTWKKSLMTHLQQEVSGLLKQENVTSIYGLALKLFSNENNTSGVQSETDGLTARKMKNKMNITKMIPFMLVPGLLLAGIMPWVIPKVKMLVMTVGILNQVAFTSALVSLIRGYVFDTSPNEHIFYINHGYHNKKHHQHKHEGFKRNDIILKNNQK